MFENKCFRIKLNSCAPAYGTAHSSAPADGTALVVACVIV